MSPDPLKAAGQENHTWYSIFAALGLTMTFAMLVILSSDGAPFADPWTSLWINKLKFNVQPSYNWEVLLRCAAWVIGACTIGYLVSLFAGMQLKDEPRETRERAVKLAGYAALCTAYTYAVTLLLICALGWLLYALKIPIFIFEWMIASTIIVIPFTTWQMAKILQRTSLRRKSRILFSLLISTTTITSCLVGVILVMDSLDAGLLKYGRAVNAVRSTPVAVVVQACAKASTDVVCAVTLFPGKWQDYELIGDWKLEDVPKPNDGHPVRLNWHPGKESDRQFALVTLAARKDVTIEIRIAASLVCKPDGTFIAKYDRFFAAQGRVLGEQHDVPQQMRLRIDNRELGFVEMMEQACLSEDSA
ncbi:hypothetical protein ACKI2N_030240 [Cupriavidus sp. 30B13]|uniref:hypothetical protein n=1 Tax=Cupriavidus sp. 30B13 TaxID=3384241 RepID=UPI003B8EFE59